MFDKFGVFQKLSSPHTWGCFRLTQKCIQGAVVFPTYVGVFLRLPPLIEFCYRLPHTRGGVSSVKTTSSSSEPSSPRTWGCFLSKQNLRCNRRVFPTHVGVFLIFMIIGYYIKVHQERLTISFKNAPQTLLCLM